MVKKGEDLESGEFRVWAECPWVKYINLEILGYLKIGVIGVHFPTLIGIEVKNDNAYEISFKVP